MKRDDLIAINLPDLEEQGTIMRDLVDEEESALEREALEQSCRRVSRAQRRDEFWS